MNRQQFLDIIENPVSNKEQNLSVVKELIESFPYYAAPYVVLSKIFYDDNSIYFDKYLKLSAAYVGDRELLYDYINKKTEEPVLAVEQQEPPQQIIAEEYVGSKPEEENKPLAVETAPLTEPNPEEIRTPAEPALEEVSVTEEPPTQEGVKQAEPEPLAEIQPEPAETPIAETISEAIAQETPAEEVAPDTAGKEKAEEKPPKSRRIFGTSNADPLGLDTLVSFDYFAYQERLNRRATEEIKADVRNEPKIEEKEETKQENTDNKTYSFTEWMQRLKQQSVTKTEPVPAEAKAEKTATPVPKKQIDDIIDTFIRTEPRIKPKPAKIFSPENMAQQSAEEDFSLATETLANIYLRQGLDEKAIEIFRQLILKFPEKSSYFAGKIEAIKNKDN